MVSSRLNSVFSFSASARSMASRFGCSRSRLRYSASSASSEKSSCKMSPKAVRRIQSGMACSEEGQIKRFSVITSVNRQARAESPASCKIRFISNWPQSWCPTCTGPASRACSTWTWSGSTVTVDRSPSDPTVLFFLLRAFSTHSWISVEEPDRDSCPCKRGLELVRQSPPVFGRSGFQTSQRANGALAGAFGGLHGFDKQVIGVRFAFVGARGFTNVHWPLHVAFHHDYVKINHSHFSHYYDHFTP